MSSHRSFAPLLEGFFTQRLMQQRRASPHTIASYRDTFRLLLQFAQQRLRKAPSAWRWTMSMRRWSWPSSTSWSSAEASPRERATCG